MSLFQNENVFQLDPDTSFFIVSPRLYALRQLQKSNDNLNPLLLRLEQRGLAPVTYMHHISKIVEGKVESYRVRICRTCSGMSNLLELGSYTDVESALLINDAHELMQGRYKNLHLLCRDDANYLNRLSVRKRGSSHDLPLLQVLQERIVKNSSNEQNKGKRLLALADDLASSTSLLEQYQKSGNLSPSNRSVTNPISLDSGHSQLQQQSYDDDLDDSSKISKVSDESDGFTLTHDKSSNLQQFSSETEWPNRNLEDSKTYPSQSSKSLNSSNNLTSIPKQTASGKPNQKQNYPQQQLHGNFVSGNRPSIISPSSNPVGLLNKQMLSYEQFKFNLISLHTELLFWGYCSTISEVESFHELLSMSLYPVANNKVAVQHLKQFLSDTSIPVSMVYSIISSLFPGEPEEVSEIFRVLCDTFTQDSMPLMRYLDGVAKASNTIVELRDEILVNNFRVSDESLDKSQDSGERVKEVSNFPSLQNKFAIFFKLRR